MNGFIKLHRKLIDWQWYSDTVTKCVFLHLLLTASYKPKKWRDITINAGQLVTSQKSLGDALGFSIQQIKTALSKLQTTGEITYKSTNKYTVITVVKWEDYQVLEFEATDSSTFEQLLNNQPITNEQLSNNFQITTSKEYKNINNIINNKYIVMFDNAREKLKSSISPYTFNAWFSSLELLGIEEDLVVLGVDRKYTAAVIQSEYIDKLTQAVKSIFGDVTLKLLYAKE